MSVSGARFGPAELNFLGTAPNFPWQLRDCQCARYNFLLPKPGHGRLRALRFEYDSAVDPRARRSLGFTPTHSTFPPRGDAVASPGSRLFGFGGVPPKKWQLCVRVPNGFSARQAAARQNTPRKR